MVACELHELQFRNMPSHLHPRSTATSTLFAGTLLASFVVISIPHIFPCPRPRRQYLDTDSQLRIEEANLPAPSQAATGSAKPNAKRSMEAEAAALKMLQEEARRFEKEARLCPVPKPSGWVGRILGFEADSVARDSRLDES